MNKRLKIVLPLLLILALIGISANLGRFLSGIGTAVILVALIYFGYRFYLSRRYGTKMFSKPQNAPTRAQLKKAQRTSTVKNTKPHHSPLKKTKQTELNKSGLKKVPKRRSAPHLTVIEGKASKQKKKKKA
ncbi:hypothetical protein [Shouchella patagoniensis]|uniref:hypothetical protein n=1 Tax=Shouchella patagoniensis TaxID=228576 RepID=UPI0009952AA8|nr:hypothetical protein [Shouchella patagoniensis]